MTLYVYCAIVDFVALCTQYRDIVVVGLRAGKSQLHKVTLALTDPADIGTIDDQTEDVFGLGAVFRCKFLAAYELKGPLKLSKSTVHKLISGEAVTIATPHATAATNQIIHAPIAFTPANNRIYVCFWSHLL